jgi:hypothetical protein
MALAVALGWLCFIGSTRLSKQPRWKKRAIGKTDTSFNAPTLGAFISRMRNEKPNANQSKTASRNDSTVRQNGVSDGKKGRVPKENRPVSAPRGVGARRG